MQAAYEEQLVAVEGGEVLEESSRGGLLAFHTLLWGGSTGLMGAPA